MGSGCSVVTFEIFMTISCFSIKIYKNLLLGLISILQIYKYYKCLIKKKKKRLQPYSKSKLGLESNLKEILSVNCKVIFVLS